MGWGVYDTSGVLSYAFFPSILGGISGAILLVIYHFQGIDDKVVNASSIQGVFGSWDTLQRKGGFLAGATFVSIAVGTLTSTLCGFIVAIYYK